jgi:hypothetical protein
MTRRLVEHCAKQHGVREGIGELDRAVAIEPGYTLARRELRRLLGMLH